MQNHNFNVQFINSFEHLEASAHDSMDTGKRSYYLFVSQWDKVSNNLMNEVLKSHNAQSSRDLFVVDTFEIPNGLFALRSVCQEFGVNRITNYSQIPILAIINGDDVVLLEHNVTIFKALAGS
jgi:hypothetical protein